MFREIRRQERVLDENRMQELLETGEYGVLSSTSTDGYAYGVPLSFVRDKDQIYFHCSMIGHKIDNISVNPLVSFCIVGETQILPSAFSTGYESVIVFGNMETVTTDEEKKKALRLIVKKYSPDFVKEGEAYIERAILKTNVLRLNIQRITGKGRE